MHVFGKPENKTIGRGRYLYLGPKIVILKTVSTILDLKKLCGRRSTQLRITVLMRYQVPYEVSYSTVEVCVKKNEFFTNFLATPARIVDFFP